MTKSDGTNHLSLLILLCAALLGACGGDGESSADPLWVETDVVVADVDGDGWADVLTLAMMSYGGNREGHLIVNRQTAPGVFAAPITTLVGTYPWRLALGDVSHDGKSDAVTSDGSTTWLLWQEVSDPGQFHLPQALSSSGGYFSVIADLDGDGLLDIALNGGSSTGKNVVIRYQDRTMPGTFGPPVSFALPGYPGELATGDIDGDGRTDLLVWVVTEPGGAYTPIRGGLVAMFQQAGGAFAISTILAPQSGLNVDRLAIADANGDGRLDLLASLTPSSTDYTAKLVVVPQAAIRGFGTPIDTSLAGVQGILDAVFADLNGDGVVDASVAGFWPESGGPLAAPNVRSRTNLLINNRSGVFSLYAAIEMPVAVSRLTAGDVDRDGRIDIVVYGDEQCFVMLQSATPGTFLAPRALR